MRHAIAALALLAGLFAGIAARAQETPRPIDHYKRTVWTSEAGAPVAAQDMAQTRDGYLWLAAGTGLFRFDGIQFERVAPQQGPHAPSERVTALLAARSGELWVGHGWGGVSVYRNGKLVDANPRRPNGIVRRIVQDRDDAIWVATDGIRRAGLRRYFHGNAASVIIGAGAACPGADSLSPPKNGSAPAVQEAGMMAECRSENVEPPCAANGAPDMSLRRA